MTAVPSGIGRFKILCPLGSGGSGTVYAARDRATGATVAIKVLREQTAAALAQFKGEFRALSEIAHPGVVRFSELFEDDGRFYLTMELVEGQNFFEYVRGIPLDYSDSAGVDSAIRRAALEDSGPAFGARSFHPQFAQSDSARGKFDEARLRDGLRQLASGLAAIHAAGLVHRDVKPRNVLVTREGRVVLLDFGLAISDDGAQKSEFAGTAAYMAPEQVGGSTVTATADWYAVGVVLYEALTGRLPHVGTPIESLTRKMRSDLEAPSTIVPGLPEDLSALCTRLLERDPARRPSEQEIFEALGMDVASERARASFRSRLHFSRAVFVAREREFEILHDAVRQSRQDGCTVVLVVGESGVGKSALLRHFIRQIREDHPETLVLSGRCYERETLPYAGVDLVMDALTTHFRNVIDAGGEVPSHPNARLAAELFPVLRAVEPFSEPFEPSAEPTADPRERRRKAFQVLRELFGSIAAERPVLIHLDDAQWMDAESVALLESITAGDDAPSISLVVTQRPSPMDPLALVARGVTRVTRIDLGPLSIDDGRRLALELMRRHGAESAGDAASIADQAGGHPLFIHELVLHVGGGKRPAANLEEVLRARIGALQPESRRLLEVAALASTPLAHEVLRNAAQIEPQAYAWVMFGLRAENLMSFRALDGREPAQTYHDRIREFVISGMDGAARRLSHRHLAESIERIFPDDFDSLAHHYFEAEVRDRARSYAREAADKALQKLAFERAAYLFGIAAHSEDDPDARAVIEEQRGQALANAGRGAESAEEFLRAATRKHSNAALDLRRRAGEQLLRSGHIERGVSILNSILRGVGVRAPDRDLQSAIWLVRTLLRLKRRGLHFRARAPAEIPQMDRLRIEACWTVAMGISMLHHLRSAEMQARTLLLALDAGDRGHTLKSSTLLGAVIGMSGGPTRRIGAWLTALARETAGPEPSIEHEAWLLLTTGVAAMGDWDFRTAERCCVQAEKLFSKVPSSGIVWEVTTSQAFALWAMVFQGKLRAAADLLPELVASARARGDRYALTTLALSPIHLLGLAADEPERVREECRAAIAGWPEELACFQHMCAEYVLAQARLYEGNGALAWRHVEQAWAMLRRSHISKFQRVDLLGLRGRAAMARAVSGDRRAAWLRRAASDSRRLEREQIGPAVAMGALIRGAAASAVGDKRSASAVFGLARRHFEREGMMLHGGVARLGAAVASGDVTASRAAEHDLREAGVANPRQMLELWIPGLDYR